MKHIVALVVLLSISWCYFALRVLSFAFNKGTSANIHSWRLYSFIYFHFFCFISALQSPLRVHRDNIYVRHSNLMLEVGTGVDPMAESWELRVCFYCDAIRASTSSCAAPCRTAALSHSQALRACLCLWNVSSVHLSKRQCFSLTETVLDVSSFSADCFSSEQPFNEQHSLKWTSIKQTSMKVSYIAEGIHITAVQWVYFSTMNFEMLRVHYGCFVERTHPVHIWLSCMLCACGLQICLVCNLQNYDLSWSVLSGLFV